MYEKQIADRVRELPVDKQQEVLELVEFLRSRGTPAEDDSPEGELEYLNIQFSEEDLEELRREMWGSFPRDISA